jgi:nitroreductase
MDFAEVVRRRRMVRAYSPEPVDPAVVRRLLDLARRAPSAGNTQGWRFLVLDTAADRDRFWSATAGDGPPDSWLRGLASAPVLVVCFAVKDDYLDRYAEPDKGWTDRDETRWPVPYWHVDTGMAALLLLLGAVDDGLAGCFFGVPGERLPALRAAFSVPDGFDPVGVVSLGRPAPDRRSPSLARGRRPFDEVVAYGRFPADGAR